jgi:four helix bundle protein
MGRVDRLEDLHVYNVAYGVALVIFRRSRHWPMDERYSLTRQIRRSSRSVCANMAEAWAKRRYPPHFVSKLSDAHAEALETRVWLQFARDCGYANPKDTEQLSEAYDIVVAGLLRMMAAPGRWAT